MRTHFSGARLRPATLALMTLLILAACAGAPATTRPAAATPTRAPATSTAAVTVAPTVAATATSTATATAASTAATGSVDLCTVVSTAELAAASGLDLTKSTPSSDDLYTYCNYTGSTSGDKASTFLTKSTDTATSVFGTMKINAGQAVSGVGDEAFWSTDSYMPGLYFLKNGQLAYISGSHFGPEDPIIALGKVMASRI